VIVKRQTLTHLDKDLERWMKVAIYYLVIVVLTLPLLLLSCSPPLGIIWAVSGTNGGVPTAGQA